MAATFQTLRASLRRHGRDYLELTKPRVVALITFTAIVGMLLATPDMVPWDILLFGSLGIALMAGSAAAVNHLVDRKADAIMARTRHRPLPSGHLESWQVLGFASLIGVGGFALLLAFTNPLTAVLTFASLIGYAVIYTLFLKRATPQNIVIGGAAGAAPPLLGWTAVTGQVDSGALLLFLIIYIWTPPHFWALAIHRRHDYANADIPMLPVTHGVAFTRLHILLYTILLFLVTLLPFLTGMSGWIYLAGAVVLGLRFLSYATRLYATGNDRLAMPTFGFSIVYLFGLFAALMLDHYAARLLAKV
ncbi:MAG: protoheme IX farnesyltransferase [Candidatus Competibacteraceae bacterium]|nr:protoheme IX farnesyltransferase [Candidatus Competibacteraceae bacterium]MBK7982723.1 protoheme IX farnesyltransferase [Candidatus Competibacteraceae bacterium]MBK8898730.1 protoheme IX farnesyltransferase [Candidatus Competibacteraceae bacterium]MBK8962530.1 protoheme IX farnesyltransferase [Candidatus Competibacteraceae bacterium]MBK9951744.1 protoheme IX farnesyltransferase [Candidatus Competibacteraceae bacterium]